MITCNFVINNFDGQKPQHELENINNVVDFLFVRSFLFRQRSTLSPPYSVSQDYFLLT